MMTLEMVEVRNTEMSDLLKIIRLFEHSMEYQEKMGYPVWRNFDKNAIVKDIQDRNQYKVVIDEKTAIVFSICYSDKAIWRTLEDGNSIYIHRAVVNPEFKGQKLFKTIVDWVVALARQKGRSSVRLDTWAANPSIINYYKSFGFTFVENFTTPDSEEFPPHIRNMNLALLEYKP